MAGGADRRKYNRHPIRAEIQYGQDGTAVAASISDVSVRGLFIDTVNTLDIGEVIKFRFLLPLDPSGEPIRGEGKVTWKEDFVGMGIRFTRMPRKDWERLRGGLGEED